MSSMNSIFKRTLLQMMLNEQHKLGKHQVSKNLPKHFGSGYLHFPSIWHTVEELPSKVIPSWHLNMILAPRPVPPSIFSNQPFQSLPGWPQLISTHARNKNEKMVVKIQIWGNILGCKCELTNSHSFFIMRYQSNAIPTHTMYISSHARIQN